MKKQFKFRVKQNKEFGGRWEQFKIPEDLQNDGLYMSKEAYDWNTLELLNK